MQADRDQAALDYVENEVLHEGETIVWKGRPSPKMAAMVQPTKFLSGLGALAFGVFWMSGATVDPMMALFGLPILGFGAYMASWPVRNYLKAARSYYAITDRAVLIITAGKGYSVHTLGPSSITDYHRVDNADGTGTIRLRTSVSSGNNGPRSTIEFADGLWGVADVKGAAEAIAAFAETEED